MAVLMWYLALFAVGVAAVGSLILTRFIARIFGDFRKDMILLSLAALFAIITSLSTAILGLLETPLNDNLWNLPIFTFSLSTLIFAISMYNLNKTMSGIVVQMTEGGMTYKTTK